ncbi:MAG: hypothetical protein K6F66_02620 [Pseudobutyrivibrio sp.]|nr:hypothetical protein [Pseudobutyrivibrio sp.]
MLLTIILSLTMMVGLFLLLFAGVALIQDKRLFSSAPKEVVDVIQPREERFKGAHILGWIIAVVAMILMIAPFIIGAINGIRLEYTFLQFFIRFFIMVLLIKVYDIVFFDWILLCNKGLNFFPHYYPETRDVLNPSLFGFNKKSHIIQFVCYTVIAIVIAFVCTLF